MHHVRNGVSSLNIREVKKINDPLEARPDIFQLFVEIVRGTYYTEKENTCVPVSIKCLLASEESAVSKLTYSSYRMLKLFLLKFEVFLVYLRPN